MTQRRDLLDCLSIEEARRLGDWISGARAVRGTKVNKHHRVNAPMSLATLGETKHLRDFSFNVLPEDVRKSFENTTLSPRSPNDETMSAAPEGFWEPENPPYEDRSSRSDGSTDADTAGTGLESFEEDHPGPATIIIELKKPGRVVLELTKTSTPIWQFQRSGARTRMETHTFVTVTTIPRSPFVTSPPMAQKDQDEDSFMNDDATPMPDSENVPITFPVDSPEVSPKADTLLVPSFPRSNPRTRILSGPRLSNKNFANLPAGATADQPTVDGSDLTPTEEITALEMPESAMDRVTRPNQPIFFNRDGTVSGRTKAEKKQDEHGLSLDVHELLRTTDWTKTPLGPMEQWPQSLKTIGELLDIGHAYSSRLGNAIPASMLFVVG